MRKSATFAEAFLDGFTMAGLRKLRRPDAPDVLFAPEEDEAERTVSFEVSDDDSSQVKVMGDLHKFSTSALNGIMQAVAKEQKTRLTEEALASGPLR